MCEALSHFRRALSAWGAKSNVASCFLPGLTSSRTMCQVENQFGTVYDNHIESLRNRYILFPGITTLVTASAARKT